MTFNITNPYPYFAELAKQAEDPRKAAELRVDTSRAQVVLSLFNRNGIQPTLTPEHAGETRVTVSHETLDKWIKSQQGLAAGLSLDVPILLKLVNQELLNAKEEKQVAAALGALKTGPFENVAELAKRDDLPQMDALVYQGLHLEESPEIQNICEVVHRNIGIAMKERRARWDELYGSFEDTKIPKSHIAALIEKGIDINAVDHKGTTLLMLAASFGNAAAVEALMEHGANVHQTDVRGFTALHHAATSNSSEVIAALVKQVADVDARDLTGRTPLHVASVSSNYNTMEALIAAGADVNHVAEDVTPLIRTIALAKDLRTTQLLLANGADVNKVANRWTALQVAAAGAHLPSPNRWEIFELLLNNGAQVSVLNNSDQNALHVAAKIGNFKTIKTLIEKGTNVLQPDRNGDTPLSVILESQLADQQAIFAYLIQKGFGEALVRSMLQKGGRSSNIKALLQVAPAIQPQSLLNAIDFDQLQGLLTAAETDERSRHFLTQLVKASLINQWVENSADIDEMARRLPAQPFIFHETTSPDEFEEYHVVTAAGEMHDVTHHAFFEAWMNARGNPDAILRDLFAPIAPPSDAESDGEAYTLEVAREEIDQDPQAILNALCTQFDAEVLNNLEIVFVGEAGQDVGGLGRQFINQLFSALSRHMHFVRMENGLMRPAIRENSAGEFPSLTDQQKSNYNNLGKLIMFCLNAETPYPIGMLFDQGVFVALTQLDTIDLLEDFDSFDFSDPEVFNKIFHIYKEMNRFIEDDVTTIKRLERSLRPQSAKEWEEAEQTALLDPAYLDLKNKGKMNTEEARKTAIQAAVRKYVVDTKLQPALAPLFEIAKGMLAAPFEEVKLQDIQAITPAALSHLLQGTVSQQDILNHLHFENVPENIQEWFRKWIEEADKTKLETFIFALSGSSALGKDAEIKIKEEGQFLFHTCFNTFGIRRDQIHSEDDLKRHLTWALEYAKAQGGFDFA